MVDCSKVLPAALLLPGRWPGFLVLFIYGFKHVVQRGNFLQPCVLCEGGPSHLCALCPVCECGQQCTQKSSRLPTVRPTAYCPLVPVSLHPTWSYGAVRSLCSDCSAF